jgi:serine/threonine protein phosphatase PrpC
MSSSPDTAPPPGEVTIHVVARTDVGRTREHNEDAFALADFSVNGEPPESDKAEFNRPVGPRGTLFMVAEGMGGAAAGEIASAMATEIVLGEMRSLWITNENNGAEDFVRAIKHATKTANERINSFAAGHPEYRGMGTTATVAGFLGDTLYLAQVGDSRAYLVRNGVAQQITKDQSLMQKLIEAGELTEEEAAQSERRNIILQALGPEPQIKIDLTHQSVRRGDALVLCSDGLSGQITKDDIGRIVAEAQNIDDAPQQLIDLANENGGPDNITVIVARFDGPGLQPSATEDEIGHRVFPLPESGQTPTTALDVVIEDLVTEAYPVPARPATGPLRLGESTVPNVLIEEPKPVQAPVVSPQRRGTGQLISLALLGLLLVAAGWLVVHYLGDSSDPPHASAPKR